MDLSLRGALWIIAAGVICAGLYYLREPLTQFALAVLLWFTIDILAKSIRRYAPKLPRSLALPLAIFVVLLISGIFVYIVASNIGQMAGNVHDYQGRLNQILLQAHTALGLSGPAPTVDQLLSRVDPGAIVSQIAQEIQHVISETIFILIYLGFLFPAISMMRRKLVLIFPNPKQRDQVRHVIDSISESMEGYLWVQTISSLIITALTYVTLLVIGLDNALFWSFLIFFLNYIPTIGSIVAVLLPTAFALVQFPTLGQVGAVAIGVGAWQFIIGNFLQPRMTGDSLNLSSVIVLLALAIWGAIWGIAGAFLAAPLTVMLMIILAQFPSTRWIAILLSQDGKPTPENKLVNKSQPA
ncbi:MAG TPA: AI-2E family transporter [Caulobacterales bacterium]|nr:AI-2E family transporter [Caulobacterales bacterium]